ncbi:NADPH oxidase 4-like [Lineus longissimus]|uniref:NADPH oxidase 4-like n=1 Tax=Lineus longissimus TaxID=88925 RepID=UPI00315D40A8
MVLAVRTWLANNGAKHIVMLIWTGLNAVLFWHTYTHYKYEPSYFYLHQMLGAGLCISRGTASVLNLNCCLLLLPMCRATMTAIRTCGNRLSRRTICLLIDHCKGFHIACAYTVIVASVIHYSAHMINAQNFTRFYNTVYQDVNAANSPQQNPLVIVLGSVPGMTGMLMMLVLVLICASSTYMRIGNYDIFWLSHRLYLVFFLLLLTHALRGVLKQQTNIHQHWPGCRYGNVSIPWPEAEPEYHNDQDKMNIPCRVKPSFVTLGSSTWMWIIGPILLYLLDAIFRCARRRDDAQVVHVQQYANDVIEINLSKEGFWCRPGQFVLISCPKLSHFEWHPYSITRVPSKEKQTFSIHLKTTGDWSGDLVTTVTHFTYSWKLTQNQARISPQTRNNSLHLGCDDKSHSDVHGDTFTPANTFILGRLKDYLLDGANSRRQHPWATSSIISEKLLVDGPFGSPSSDILKYPVSVCIAGGIGVTPFIGLLNWLRTSDDQKRLQRMYFIWVIRDSRSITCFADTMCLLYSKLWQYNKPDTFVIQLHVTGKDVESQREYVEQLRYNYPILSSRVHFGRPKFKAILSGINEVSDRGKIGVFCCGPKTLGESVEKACYRSNKGRSIFIYHHESF